MAGATLQGDEARPWRGLYAARLIRVVDGDTLDLDVDLGLETHRHVRVRLVDAEMGPVDTPEVRGAEREEGKRASAFVREKLRGAPDELRVLTGKKESKGKYGRWIAAVFYLEGPARWVSLGDALRDAGFDKLHPPP